MIEICLLPMSASNAGPAEKALRTGMGPSAGAAELWLAANGELEMSLPGGGSGQAGDGARAATGRPGQSLLGVFMSHGLETNTSYFFVPRSPLAAINGVQPLRLALVEPGDLISVGPQQWLVVSEWTPEPQPAPAALANKPCAVCGAALGLAPTCRCPCGRYSHLEKPSAPTDPEALNCFLMAPCSVCGREPSLEPVLIPQPHEKLVGSNETE